MSFRVLNVSQVRKGLVIRGNRQPMDTGEVGGKVNGSTVNRKLTLRSRVEPDGSSIVCRS